MIDFINVYKIINYNQHKDKFINLINKIPETYLIDENQKISHTDWKIPITMKREYRDYFIKYIVGDFSKNLCSKFDSKEIEVKNIWFQVYKKGDFHNIHRHCGSQFTNVFFVNLPHKTLKTKIYNLDKNIINVNVEEGDILTFPAFLKHESVVNTCEESKIIISFNLDII